MNRKISDSQLSKIRSYLASQSAKVLVIQTAFFGDVILLTPLLRVLRKHYPSIQLKALTIPQCAPLLNNLVDEVLMIDKNDKTNRRYAWETISRKLKEENFGLALIPHRSYRSAFLARKVGIPYRIGFNRGLGRFLNNIIRPYRLGMYEGSRNLELINHIADVEDDGLPELHPSESDCEVAKDILKSLNIAEKQFIILAPGSVWETKRWSSTKYIELRKILSARYKKPCLVVGSKADMEVCKQIAVEPKFNLAGRLSMMQFAALASQATLLISGDSAPAHVATAMLINQIVIFGSTSPWFGFMPPTDKARFVEVKLWCRPCTSHGRRMCPLFNKKTCLERIVPLRVAQVAEELLDCGR